MKSALIIVDVQNDFLPGGSLGLPGSDEIIPVIELLALEKNLVVASRDWHPFNHFSFRNPAEFKDGSWPPHCVQGTKGARIPSPIKKLVNYTISKGMKIGAPDEYSAFSATTLRPVRTLHEILKEHEIKEVVITGLVLEICVKFTALDAMALGYKTVVPLAGTKALNLINGTAAVQQLEKAGVQVIPRAYAQ